jgi:phosphopantothenoylcysteine decarboxylase / phosphopantothenate---cysteine ligase
MSKSKVLVLITGSIAAYKACYLISKLVQNDFAVKIAASKSALNFIGTPSLEGLIGQKIHCDTFEDGNAMAHINLIRWADLIITIPASANFINKIANGIGDDLVTTLALAHDFKKPFLICPAMNTQMYLHPATQKSLANLRQYGFTILETQSGVLACGEIGLGKLLDPDLIYDEITNAIPAQDYIKIKNQAPKRVLITSGGTIEKIDNVRAITNTSTGKTGAQLAQILFSSGANIDFLSSINGAKPDCDFNQYDFTDFKSLQKQLMDLLNENQYDMIVHCAAISDFSVDKIFADTKEVTDGKISSSNNELQITLKRNPKLINQIKNKSNAILIGFKLSVNAPDIIGLVKKQIQDANVDYVVQNDLGEINGDKSRHIYNLYNNEAKKITSINGANALGLELAQILWGK